jgi:hypothetical protein
MAEFLDSLFIIRTGSLHKHMRLTEAEVLPKRTIKKKIWRIATWRGMLVQLREDDRPALHGLVRLATNSVGGLHPGHICTLEKHKETKVITCMSGGGLLCFFPFYCMYTVRLL